MCKEETMYELIFVTRDDLTICENFYNTKKEAIDAMVEEMLTFCDFESLDEIVEAADRGDAGFSDDESWAETKDCGTAVWKIVKIPTEIEQEV